MPTVEWMEDEVRKAVPDAIEITVVDLTGGQDHFHVRVVSPTFEGMRPLPRQRILLGHLKPYIPSEIHALGSHDQGRRYIDVIALISSINKRV